MSRAQVVPDGRHWLLMSVSTGAEASLRVHVWRTLRNLGAIYIHKSVCLLPDLPQTARATGRLVARVRDQGGQARILHLTSTDPTERAELIDRQRSDRDDEYAELVGRTPEFLAEIERETARGRATYAEVEESEADLERYEKWLGKIAARDYFRAPGAGAAREAVARCRAAFEAFEARALAADPAADTGEGDTDDERDTDDEGDDGDEGDRGEGDTEAAG